MVTERTFYNLVSVAVAQIPAVVTARLGQIGAKY